MNVTPIPEPICLCNSFRAQANVVFGGGLDVILSCSSNEWMMNEVNPYSVSANPGDLTDFRSRAVVVSETLRRGLPGGVSPERGGVSCCLVRQPDLSRLRKRIKIVVAVSAVLGVCGLVASLIVYHFQETSAPADKPILLAVALGVNFGAILFFFLPTYFEQWMARRHLFPAERGSWP